MKTGGDIIGKPVVTMADGKRLEKVRDIVFDEESHQMLGLLVAGSGLLGKEQFIPFMNIHSIGSDAVIISKEEDIRPLSSDEKVLNAVNNQKPLKNKKVLTESGKDLGTIADICFDETSGTVEGYEVTGGIFADMYNGRPMVPAPNTLKIGEDVVFVPDETADKMREKAGGIRKAVGSAGEQVKGMAGAVSERAKSSADSAKEAYGEFKTSGKPGEYKEQAGQKAGEVYDKAKDKTQSAWEQVKEKATELKGKASDAMEQRKIDNAVGRPVSRVVFNKHDEPILNTGEIITYEAVEMARRDGVLDVLLGSVYETRPSLSEEDLKVDQPGKAKTP